jgi:hypothetical protein
VVHFALEELLEELRNSKRSEALNKLRGHLQQIKGRRVFT